MVWYGIVWYGFVWYGNGVVWYGMVWYDMVWYTGMVWYGMVWCDVGMGGTESAHADCKHIHMYIYLIQPKINPPKLSHLSQTFSANDME